MKNIEYNGAGVYRITIGGRVYVGSSIRVCDRIRQHRMDMRAGREPKGLQKLYDEGHEMHVDILEKLDDNKTIYDLLQAEQKWIDQQDNPLNVRRPGNVDPMASTRGLINSSLSVLEIAKKSSSYKYKRRLLLCVARRLETQADWIDRVTSPIMKVRKRGRRQEEAGDK